MRIITIFFVFAAWIATGLAASAQPIISQATTVEPASSNEEISALELRLADLIIRGDWDEYEKHLASDYTHIAADGKLENKQDIMAALRNGPRKIIALEPEELRARIYGTTAVLQGLRTASVRESGRVVTKVTRFTKVFVQQDGRWLVVAEQETAIGK